MATGSAVETDAMGLWSRPKSGYWLTDDELERVVVDGTTSAWFRLRVWRRRGAPAVVLFGQHAGGPPPGFAACKLANLAYGPYLRFHPEGMHFFESLLCRGEWVLMRWSFDWLGGSPDRLRAYHGDCRRVSWRHLFDLVGADFPLE